MNTCKAGVCWWSYETDICGLPQKQTHISLCVQETEMIRADLKSKISVGQHVWHAAMQLAEATCRPDVTQHSPSTPKGPQPLALWTFPLARIHPHCLDKLTIGCPCIVCVCVCVWITECGYVMFVSASLEMEEFVQQTTKHSCMCVQTCTRAHVQQWVSCCFSVCMFVIIILSVGLCALRCPLLTAVHKGNCWRLLGFPHSPPEYKTLTQSLLQFTWRTPLISFLLVCICAYPIKLSS